MWRWPCECSHPLRRADARLVAHPRRVAQGQAAGRFRSGRAATSEQEVIGREAAGLLTARQRLQLSAAGGLSQAGAQLGETSLSFLGAESDLESGLAEFFQGQQAQSNQGMFDAFKLFLQSQRGG